MVLPAKTSAEVEHAIAELYGPVDLRRATGLIHVVSTFEEPDGTLKVLRIGDAAPRSDTDFFVLNLARARADAIVTTGQILRDEPSLRYDLQGGSAEGLARFRREILRKQEPPRVIVLTSGAGLRADHPAFHGWARPIIFTSDDGAAHLEGIDGLELVRVPRPSLAAVWDWTRTRDLETVTVEAGPNTARQLYRQPRHELRELMLTVFEGGRVPPEARGDALVTRQRLREVMRRVGTPSRVDEPSGPWSFERWVSTSVAR